MSLALPHAISDAQWPDAVRVVADIARHGGFGAPDTAVDRPGNHEVVLYGERESLLRFGSGTYAATLAVQSGCHLPAADHGPYTPAPTY